MRENRRGFSTFDIQIEMGHWPNSGDLVHIESTVAHVGSSSIRMVHRLMNSTKNTQLAELSQFGVQLDLDKRKPARLPSPISKKPGYCLAAKSQSFRKAAFALSPIRVGIVAAKALASILPFNSLRWKVMILGLNSALRAYGLVARLCVVTGAGLRHLGWD